jgi:hypothetical protein
VGDLLEIVAERNGRQLVQREPTLPLMTVSRLLKSCDAARELADCFDLLRLTELVLEPLLRAVDGENQPCVTSGKTKSRETMSTMTIEPSFRL